MSKITSEESRYQCEIDAPEKHTWKLVAKTLILKEKEREIREPLLKELQRKFQIELQKAFSSNEDYLKALEEKEKATEDLVFEVKDSIPKGYEVISVDEDSMKIICRPLSGFEF